jgi:hypothetical protein
MTESQALATLVLGLLATAVLAIALLATAVLVCSCAADTSAKPKNGYGGPSQGAGSHIIVPCNLATGYVTGLAVTSLCYVQLSN